CRRARGLRRRACWRWASWRTWIASRAPASGAGAFPITSGPPSAPPSWPPRRCAPAITPRLLLRRRGQLPRRRAGVRLDGLLACRARDPARGHAPGGRHDADRGGAPGAEARALARARTRDGAAAGGSLPGPPADGPWVPGAAARAGIPAASPAGASGSPGALGGAPGVGRGDGAGPRSLRPRPPAGPGRDRRQPVRRPARGAAPDAALVVQRIARDPRRRGGDTLAPDRVLGPARVPLRPRFAGTMRLGRASGVALACVIVLASPRYAEAGLLPLHATRGAAPAILDSAGRQVLLHGVADNQLGDYYQVDPSQPTVFPLRRQDFTRMSELGFNVVRLVLSWSRLEPEPGLLSASYLREVRRAVTWANASGLYVVLDMHQDAWGKEVATP